MGGKLAPTLHLVARPYLRKVTKAFPLTPSGYEMAAERMPGGYFNPPPLQQMRVNK